MARTEPDAAVRSRPAPAHGGPPHPPSATAGSEPKPRPIEHFFAQLGTDPLVAAFAGRRPVHPFVGLSPVAPDAVADLWQGIAQTPRQRPSVAYVHIPFCANHCLFCGFYKHGWHPSDGPPYVDALIEQLRRDRDRPCQAEVPLRAVYFGGGTPTLLAAADLARLIEAVRTHLPLAPDCEITVEGRRHGFGLDQARAAFAAGANRLSLGVQSFDDRVRRRLGRHADRRTLIGFLDDLLALDQGAIVIDLIFGLPGQDAAVWEDDVGTAIDLGLDGADLYSLKLVNGTPLARAVEAGSLKPGAAEDLGQRYRQGAERMHAARWEPLSVSHWRRGTRERNLYNLLVKAGADCLAIGAGAGGSLSGPRGGYSYRNEAVVADYCAGIMAGAPGVAGLMRQSPHRHLFNRIKGELECGRLRLDALAATLRQGSALRLEAVVGPLFDHWQEAGLLTRDDRWLELTLAGRFWQVPLTQNLLLWLAQCLPHPPEDDLDD
jgi:oxygen-independent coproporphyrinogen-3 oxidase